MRGVVKLEMYKRNSLNRFIRVKLDFYSKRLNPERVDIALITNIREIAIL